MVATHDDGDDDARLGLGDGLSGGGEGAGLGNGAGLGFGGSFGGAGGGGGGGGKQLRSAAGRYGATLKWLDSTAFTL